jgi:hypothetical protein
MTVYPVHNATAVGGRYGDAYTRRTATCTTCDQLQPIVGKGLCRVCYQRARRQQPGYIDPRRRKAATVTTKPGKPISGTDHERMTLHRKGANLTQEQRRRAVRYVAGNVAKDADELLYLLHILGLDKSEGRP